MTPLRFNNTYAKLGDAFFTRVTPRGFQHPHLVSVNPEAATLLAITPQDLQSEQFLSLASGNWLPLDSDSLAAVYSGHQFGVWAGQLGDGRSLLLGEVEGPEGRWDLHLKGGGPTPYSRFGDGRAVLRSTIREYLGSEALHGLGIPTTRALCIVGSDEPVQRETVETGAMLIRLARSHVRFGSFEHFHYRGDVEAVQQLAEYVIEYFHPDLAGTAGAYETLFSRVVTATARLIAGWQAVGFAHGVLNTDNMSILGDTLDYGPYGFLDAYDPGFICNRSDHAGRYSFQNQPDIGLWNLSALANALTSLITPDTLRSLLQHYEPSFRAAWLTAMRAKLGLVEERPADPALIDSLLQRMAANQVDYTLFFRRLCDFEAGKKNAPLRGLFIQPQEFDDWSAVYAMRLQDEGSDVITRRNEMRSVNPKFILRNYMAETAIRKAEDMQDFSEIDRLLRILQRPYDEHLDAEEYAGHPPAWSGRIVVSCSS